MRFLKPAKSSTKRRLSVLDKVKLAILAGRFNTTREQAQVLMQEIHEDVSQILDIPETAVKIDAEFLGRNLDLTFTINKQNAPKGK